MINVLRVVVKEELKLRSQGRSSTRDTPCQVYFSLFVSSSYFSLRFGLRCVTNEVQLVNFDITGSLPASYLG
jgi:hypothetical protein